MRHKIHPKFRIYQWRKLLPEKVSRCSFGLGVVAFSDPRHVPLDMTNPLRPEHFLAVTLRSRRNRQTVTMASA